jgi:hypothetical protein
LANLRVIFECPESRITFIEPTKAKDDLEGPGLET